MLVKTRLKNGLTFLFRPLSGCASVSIGLWVKTGSRMENSEEGGYSHFLEHMVFKGTSTRTAKQLAEEVERVGGNMNAYTSREYTNYYVTLIRDQARLGFDIIADMVFNPLLTEEDVKSEGNVIIEEMKGYEDSPDDFIHDYYYENLFPDSSLGRNIIGTKKSVSGVTSEKIRQYYNKYYQPENMVLSVCGGISEKEALELAEEYYSRGGNIVPSVTLDNPVKKFGMFVEKRNLEQVNFILGGEGLGRDYLETYRSSMALSILGGGMSSRLFQKIREEKGLCYSIHSYPSFYTGAGSSNIICSTSPSTLGESIQSIMDELRHALDKGFTDREFEDIKSNLAGSIAIGSETAEQQMNGMALQEIYYGKYYSIEDRIAEARRVEKSEMNDSFRRMFGVEELHLSAVGDIKKRDLARVSLKP